MVSKKSRLKKAIGDSEREIVALEQKRERSQAALMRAMLMGEKPDKDDEYYFKVFSSLIDNEREHLKQLYAELEALKK